MEVCFIVGLQRRKKVLLPGTASSPPGEGFIPIFSILTNRFKRQDGGKTFSFAKLQMSDSTHLEKKIIKKKMSGISFRLLFLLEEGGSWRGEEGWDVYEVCGDFWRKLTEGGQMVGGTGNVILSLSLLGRPVQTQPRSRMARSHLQHMAILVLHEKNGWWGSAPCWLEDRDDFFPSWSISGDVWEKVQGCAEETCLVAWTWWHCPGTWHEFSKPIQRIPMGCGSSYGQEATSPRKEVVCPPTSTSPQTL